MDVVSECGQQYLTGSPDDWMKRFLCRMHQEPWAVGGAVVIGVFVLGTLSLVIFALVYGCCRSPAGHKQGRKKSRKQGVI
ncbi:hypothetical protein JOB18_000630 [Solea senegalensis]|uniref:Uncharacterized protein n=1 Tax=Solea senegalensis TaxID=28829 RepID=A0AAV6RLN8_SOLSE|nr:hypothetical protein JOB18_000630 [Solea senegalensis]